MVLALAAAPAMCPRQMASTLDSQLLHHRHRLGVPLGRPPLQQASALVPQRLQQLHKSKHPQLVRAQRKGASALVPQRLPQLCSPKRRRLGRALLTVVSALALQRLHRLRSQQQEALGKRRLR